MKRADDFEQRRQHIAHLTDEELYDKFWELTAQVVDPLLELGRKNTTPSVERAVLLRMGVSSLDADYVESGYLEATVDEIVELILPYIQMESQAGISEERFFAAVQSNLDFCKYRSASVRGQLSGDIPKTTTGQEAAPETLIDCSDFVSPDSGSLSQLLFPEGSGLYFEDLIDALVPRINTMATVAILPLDTILNLIGFGDFEGGLVQSLEESGKVNDSDALKSGIKQLVLNFVKDVSDLLIAPLAMIGGLVFAFRYGRKRHAEPLQKKGGIKNAV